jgi:hypothetical protein
VRTVSLIILDESNLLREKVRRIVQGTKTTHLVLRDILVMLDLNVMPRYCEPHARIFA